MFHKSSTGESHGLYPDTKSELTPLGVFYNNRVHSNFKVTSISCCSWLTKNILHLLCFLLLRNKVYTFSEQPNLGLNGQAITRAAAFFLYFH